MTGNALLEARGLRKIYGDGSPDAPVVRGVASVSLALRQGEILGLVGESGCGKSTLARLLVGLEKPDAGDLTVAGEPLFGPGLKFAPAGRRPIQMVFQDPWGSLNPRMRVRDIVGEGLRVQGRLSRGDIVAKVRRYLALVGLGEDSLEKFPHEFSGGQRQRVCIARSIILEPRVLIADEAASALDVSVQMQILNLLLDLRDTLGLSIIFISHDMGVIEYLCDRIAVMYAGRVVEENVAATLLDAPRHPYTARLRAARQAGDRAAKAAEPALPDNAEVPRVDRGCAYAPRCARADERCRETRPDLAREGDAAFACHRPLDAPA